MLTKGVHRTCGWLAGILLCALPMAAQLQVGEDWKFNLNGNLGYSYNGSIDNGVSGHSMGFTGDATLKGSYYNPNFLNFSVQPYYGRVQSNTLFGSLSNSTGVTATANLFSGSRFPGSISYGRGKNVSSEFGIPASDIGLAQHGDAQNLAINWNEIVPGLPTLNASYLVGDETSTIFGTQGQSSQNNRTLSLLSTYKIDGFLINGGYTHRHVNTDLAEIIDGSPLPVQATNSSNTYQVNASHALPMSGSASFGWNRNSYGYDYRDSYRTSNSGVSDGLNGTVTVRPAAKLSVSGFANYSDNLLGAIPEQVLNSGTVINTTGLRSFKNTLEGVDAYYQLLSNLSVHGNVAHQSQEFLGKTYSSTIYGGSANYNLNKRFLGSLSFSLALFEVANQEGNQVLGGVGNVNFDRKIDRWDVNANFSYSQNVQTIVLVYTTSSYGWVANARRQLGNRMYFAAGYGGSHSGLTNEAGLSSGSHRWSGTFLWKNYNVNGFYSFSNGAAAFTPTGLVSVPVGVPPSLFAPGSVILYNSKAVGGNVGGVFMHRLTFSLGYGDSRGSTVDPLISTVTQTQLYNAVMQYRLRKIFLNTGYTRLRQAVGTPGVAPVVVTSYFIGFSRWFDFF